MNHERYGDVEIVSSPLIVNKEGKILLIKSNKWGGGKFLIPGGHVEKNETILEAAKREGEEEVGIELEPKYCVNVGELINSPLFDRSAHLVYFHIVCEAKSSDVKLNEELSEFVWIDPKEHKKFPLIEGFAETLENFINNVKIDIKSDRF